MSCGSHPQWMHDAADCPYCVAIKVCESMSSDAKAWKDKNGWHAICDATKDQIDGTEYGLVEVLIEIEYIMKAKLHWEIFEFGNGWGLRGYRAK